MPVKMVIVGGVADFPRAFSSGAHRPVKTEAAVAMHARNDDGVRAGAQEAG